MYFFRSAALTTLVLTTAIVAAPIAHAQVTTYGTRTSFNAATSGLTTFTFDGYAPPGGFSQYSTATGLIVQGVTFTGGMGKLFVNGISQENPFGGSQYLTTDLQQALSVALPVGTTAFGADFSNFGNSSFGATLSAVINGVTFTFQEPSDTSAVFAGFTSSTPITSLSFSGGTYGPALDNVSFGNGFPAAVPEASSAAGLSIGLAGLSLLTFRARRRVRLTV